jgi:O-antigen ligase
MAMIVAASAVVQLVVELERLGVTGFREYVVTIISRADLLTVNHAVPALTAAALLLEGLALYAVTVRLIQRSPALTHRMLQALTIGAAGAAAVNILRVIRAVLRNPSFDAVVNLVTTQRINEHYGDMNAAGSYFVMTLWIAGGMAFAAGSRGWVPACAALALALWLTGSRAAILAGGIAAALLVVGRNRAIRERRWLIAGIAAAALTVAGATVVLMPARGNQKGVATSVQVRVELIRTALNMLRERPVFGIGVGEFYQRSGEFSSPTLLALFPPAQHENAHNNFLQVLAELGVAGLACFVWLLALAARRGPAAAAGDRQRVALAGGVIAFLITCLGGHPLLIPEVAMTFWLALGVMSAGPSGPTTTPAPSPPAAASPRRFNRVVAAIAVVLVATIPVRARRQLADTNLEHVGIGLSSWHRTSDNRQYRLLAGRSGAVFVPADAGSVTVPLRAIPSTSWEVELHLDGRLGNVVRVIADDWTDALIVMPQSADHRRFRRVDLVVRGNPPAGTPVLLVGKVLPH